MSLRRLLLKNTSFQLVSQAVSICIGMAVNMVLSRYLGVEGFGKYNYVFAFYFFFLSVNDFGTNTIVIREISKNREKAGEIFSSIIGMKLLISLVSILLAWGIVATMHRPADLKAGLFVYAFMLPVIALQFPLLVFQVDLKMEYPSVLGILNRSFQFTLLMLVVWLKGGIPFLIAALVTADASFIPVYWFFSRKLVQVLPKMDLKIWKHVLRSSIPLGVAGLLGLFTTQANFIFLEKMAGIGEVGIYSAAFRVTTLFQLIPFMIMNTVYPIMSRYAGQDLGKLRHFYERIQIYFVGGGLLLGLGVTFLAPWVTKIIFGARFAQSAGVLSVLIWSVVLLYFSICAGNVLISMGKEKLSLVTLGVGGLVNTVLNFLLIPSHGSLGAAWATVAAFGAICAIAVGATEYYLPRGVLHKPESSGGPCP